MNNKIKTIAVLYFVLAGLGALTLLFIPLHYKMMTSFMSMDFPVKEGEPDPKVMFEQMMDVMNYMYVLIGFFGVLFSAISVGTGLCLYRKKNLTLCIIGSAICCLSFPFGTALGIWSLLILFDESVKADFVD